MDDVVALRPCSVGLLVTTGKILPGRPPVVSFTGFVRMKGRQSPTSLKGGEHRDCDMSALKLSTFLYRVAASFALGGIINLVFVPLVGEAVNSLALYGRR